ncbi:oxidoreductase [Melanomma pulvis-pyrius CBS 109.77]|uniref:Oxidoreductase n=1 Tax=Melanomma pulvis-pyrius CBS 109.77 TaxID=1314802 RepID=A0A6A6WTK0_9PLEO|nr:oxidoreductase [Melanomma pulvis-pyrius CBS 109.77]
MASATKFSHYPPFPKDVPSAALSKVSLAKLFTNDVDEAKAMFESCRSIGFFLLDLSGHEIGEAFVQDIDRVLDITKDIMALSDEKKLEYLTKPPKRLVGYELLGSMKIETIQPDRCDFFMLSRDELNGLESPPDYPPPIADNLPAFTSYLAHAQPILELICRVLSTSFDWPPPTFLSKQPVTSKSSTSIRLMKCPAATPLADLRISLVPHTDMGTITLLANVIGGLEILRPSSSNGETKDNWEHVKPEPNCLIVNVGDAMVQWSGGVLRSNVHRVTYPPGAQANHDRFSVAYLVRAAADADMRRLNGGLIPDVEVDGDVDDEVGMLAAEWENRKSMALIQGKDRVKSTGGRPLKGETR